ncbi:MAG: TIGR02147 family protein [Myxococcota bacterium]
MTHHRPYRVKYCRILRDSLAEREMTAKQLSDAVGRSKSWTSQILNGKRSLRPDGAERLARALRLPEPRRRELITLVQMDREVPGTSRQRPMGASELVESPERARRGLAEWYVGAIVELSGCEGYKPDPGWIAATLRPRITPAQAKDAMDRLVRIGLLDTAYRRIASKGDFGFSTAPDAEMSPAAKVFHRGLNDLATEALERNQSNEQFFRGGCVALSDDNLKEFRTRVAAIASEYLDAPMPESGTPNRIYLFNVGYFPASLYTDTEYDPEDLPE